jgi:hypothetical protein
MKAGDSVHDATRPDTLAHCFDHRNDGIALMACGHRIRWSRLNHNERRRQPCSRCAEALERRSVCLDAAT